MFITHDLSVVRHISDDILVMCKGQMVEKAPAKELFCRPMHPYTRGLISAIPVPGLHRERRHILLKGGGYLAGGPGVGLPFFGPLPLCEREMRLRTADTGGVRPGPSDGLPLYP